MSSEKMLEARELRAGQTVIWKGVPHLVLDHSFNKTAMRGGIVKCKLKNLFTKSIVTEELSNLRLEKAQLDKREVVFTHRQGASLKFIDTQMYEEYSLPHSDYSGASVYLEENTKLELVGYEDKLLDFILPEKVKLTISALTPINNEVQKALFKTGHESLVPLFCKVGDNVFVSTQDGKYHSK